MTCFTYTGKKGWPGGGRNGLWAKAKNTKTGGKPRPERNGDVRAKEEEGEEAKQAWEKLALRKDEKRLNAVCT